MHSSGLVHRDVKPSNVMVTGEGRVVLLDFGLITHANDEGHKSTGNHIVGTVAYMAPEQAASSEVTSRADWYALGVMFYEALTGRLPHTGAPLAVLMAKQTDTPPSPRALSPGVPRALDALCMELLAFEPGQRPSGKEVLERLGVEISPETPRLPSSSSKGGERVFVGREEELRCLEDAFACVQGGGQEVVFVLAESGFGKSELVKQFARDKQALEGVVWLSGRCFEQESVPFKALDGVMDDLSRFMRGLSGQEATALLPRRAALLTELFPVLGRVEAISQAPVLKMAKLDAIAQRQLAFSVVRELFDRLTDRYTVLIGIDDLQWADGDSLQLLQRIIIAPSMMMLCTARPYEDLEAHRETIVKGGTIVELGALGQEDATKLAQQLLAFAGGEALSAESIGREAGGHPLFIAEMVRYVVALGEGEARDVKLKLDDAIRERVARLDENTRSVLELFCLGGALLPIAVARQASLLEPQPFSRSLSQLRIGRLLRKGSTLQDHAEPYHDRVRESVAAGLSPERRRRWHARLAASLATHPLAESKPQLLLLHYEACEDNAWAAVFAERAAVQAQNVLAFVRAAELYDKAIVLGQPEGEKASALQFALGIALARAGHNEEAARRFLLARDATPDLERKIACTEHAARNYALSGEAALSIALYNEVCAAIDLPLIRAGALGLIQAAFWKLWIMLRGTSFEPVPESHFSARELHQLDVLSSIPMATMQASPVHMLCAHTRSVAWALRKRAAERSSIMLLTELQFQALQSVKNVPKSIAQTDALVERLNAHGSYEAVTALALAYKAGLHYYSGNLEVAATMFDEALKRLATNMPTSMSNSDELALWRTHCHLHLGSFGWLRKRVLRAVQESARTNRLQLMVFERVYNLVWLMDDDTDEAYRRIENTRINAIGFTLTRVWALKAKMEHALYTNTVADVWDGLEAERRLYRRSAMWSGVQITRIEHQWLHARMTLDLARDDPRSNKKARRLIRRITRQRDYNFAVVWGRQLEVGLAIIEGSASAAQLLREHIDFTREHARYGASRAARLRLGELLGGEEGDALVKEVSAEWKAQGITRPSRFARIFLPDIVAPS